MKRIYKTYTRRNENADADFIRLFSNGYSRIKNKLFALSAIFVCILAVIFTACEEDEIFSRLHEYTPEELAYRDSVEAAKAGVKADFIITQDIELTYGNWASVEVPLEVTSMCEKLGYADADALTTAIGAFDGDVRLLAVNQVTKADFTEHVVDEAGVQEGFVFSKAGEPGSAWDWPTDPNPQLYSMWCVYNVNNMAFTIGMRTGVLETGKTYKIIILWKKGDYRLATIFNVSIVEPEEENPNAYVADKTITKNVMLVSSGVENDASVIATLNGATLATDLGYAGTSALSTALGTVEWNTQVNNEVDFFGVNASTGIDYTGNYTAGMGYWYAVNGDICAYSNEEAALYADLDPATLKLTIGQKGGKVQNGTTYKLIVMFANASNYRVALELNVTVVVDTPPAGDPYEVTVTHTLVHPITAGWEQDIIDVTSIMRDAFKMTTADINAAIADKTLQFYAVEPDLTQKPSTSDGNDYPGHWINADGTVATDWQDGEIFVQLQATAENLKFMLLNQPSNITTATTITVKQVAELNGGKVNFVFNVVLTEEAAEPYEADYIRNIGHIANDAYTTTDIDVTDIMTHALKIGVSEITTAISNSELEFYAINADDSHSPSTGEYPGHWFDASGNAMAWGDGAFGCVNLKIENERIVLKVYNFPGVTSGEATIRQVAQLNGGQVNFAITIGLK